MKIFQSIWQVIKIVEFKYPLLLGLLILPILYVFWEWTRKGHPLFLPFDNGKVRGGTWLHILVSLATLAPTILIAVAIICLAQPKRSGPPEEAQIMTNVLFCLDVSGSMTSLLGNGTRYEGAMQAIKEFAKRNSKNIDKKKVDDGKVNDSKFSFGLTFFGSACLQWVPITKDVDAIVRSTHFIGPKKLPYWFGGGTEIDKALYNCHNQLKQCDNGDKMIILITDGQWSGDANTIGQKLTEDDITVYAIIVGESSGSTMNTLTALTGGEVFDVNDSNAMDTIFSHIENMQKAKVEKVGETQLDYFRPFALLGLIALVLHVSFSFVLRYTPW